MKVWGLLWRVKWECCTFQKIDKNSLNPRILYYGCSLSLFLFIYIFFIQHEVETFKSELPNHDLTPCTKNNLTCDLPQDFQDTIALHGAIIESQGKENWVKGQQSRVNFAFLAHLSRRLKVSYTLLKPQRHSLRCHDFMVHALLQRMCTNVVYFRVMRRLCRRE